MANERPAGPSAAIRRVAPAEAHKLMLDEAYTYVDVRTEAEYAAGHPKGAFNVPIAETGPRGMTPNPAFLDVMQALFAVDAKIVVGCAAGGRSSRAAEILASAGFVDVVDQRAGYDGTRGTFGSRGERGWAAAGLPCETATAGGSYAELQRRALD